MDRQPRSARHRSASMNMTGGYQHHHGAHHRRNTAALAAPSERSTGSLEHIKELEEELAHLRDSTKTALQQSWNEVEMLQQEVAKTTRRSAELEEELERTKANEEHWRLQCEEARERLFDAESRANAAEEKAAAAAATSSAMDKVSSAPTLDENTGQIRCSAEDCQGGRQQGESCEEKTGLFTTIRNRCSMEVVTNASGRMPRASSGTSWSRSSSANEDDDEFQTLASPHGEDAGTSPSSQSRKQSLHMKYVEEATSEVRLHSNEDSLNPLEQSARTAFAGLRLTFLNNASVGGGAGSRRNAMQEEEERHRKMELELLEHMSEVEREKNAEIEELRIKLSGRDMAISELERNTKVQAAAAANLRAEVQGAEEAGRQREAELEGVVAALHSKMYEKKALIHRQAKKMAECQDYIAELTDELAKIYGVCNVNKLVLPSTDKKKTCLLAARAS